MGDLLRLARVCQAAETGPQTLEKMVPRGEIQDIGCRPSPHLTGLYLTFGFIGSDVVAPYMERRKSVIT